jgi:hypothetical protein
MWQTCRRKVPDSGWWLDNGGGATLISYGQDEGDQADVTVVLEEHLKWIEQLPLMHVDKHRIFVHAGVNQNYSLNEQNPQDVIWKIYDDRDEGGHGQRHIVHGHHQHAQGPILKKNRTNLDTFAWYTGRLVIAVFDDETPGGPLEFLECRAKPYSQSDWRKWATRAQDRPAQMQMAAGEAPGITSNVVRSALKVLPRPRRHQQQYPHADRGRDCAADN